MTVDQCVKGPWRDHAETLAKPTRAKYKWALLKHLRELRVEQLGVLDVARLATHQRLLIERGASSSTVREVLTRLSGILQTVVEQVYMTTNPARSLRKVPAEVSEEVRPLAPVELERLIAQLDGRDRAVVLLGRSPLRPTGQVCTWRRTPKYSTAYAASASTASMR